MDAPFTAAHTHFREKGNSENINMNPLNCKATPTQDGAVYNLARLLDGGII